MALDLDEVTSRPYRGDADLPALVDLIGKGGSADNDGRFIKAETVKQFLSRPRVEPPQLWQNKAGQLLMNATLLKVFVEEGEKHYLEVRALINIHPEARGRGLEDRLLAWCVERTRKLGEDNDLTATLAERVTEDNTEERRALERNGFEVVRYFFTMENRLAGTLPGLQFPTGYVVRDRAGLDDPAGWADLYNQSFVDHYHHHHMSVAEVEHENLNPNYRPDLDLVVQAPDNTWAALCYAQINPGETVDGEQIGWIGLLGARRGYRNQGIGRAALLAGMHRLQQEGCRRIRLHVDADSLTGATHLYDAVGFGVVETALHYSRRIS